MKTKADSMFVSSQWEMALLYNGISHWLGASLESALNTTSKHAVCLKSIHATVSCKHKDSQISCFENP